MLRIAAFTAFSLKTTVSGSGVSIDAISPNVALRVETTPCGGLRSRS
jgi:hypothetical protein